ncbi:hypothetical protein HZC35_04820 [Candidatus Saganbacteria bacterium]|nr:hypothetical protein [Candidatus Saganbacteria bacterium]
MLQGNDEINKYSLEDERKTEKRFKKMGYDIKKIKERQEKGRRTVDYLIMKGDLPLFLCEVKSKMSGGMISGTNYQQSILDIDYVKSGRMGGLPTPDFADVLSDADDQCKKYKETKKEHSALPFIVAIWPCRSFTHIEDIDKSMLARNKNISAVIQFYDDNISQLSPPDRHLNEQQLAEYLVENAREPKIIKKSKVLLNPNNLKADIEWFHPYIKIG